MSNSHERFSNRVENYVKYRPGYPKEMLEFFRAELNLKPSSVVADIGSGTGISSKIFLENGNAVYGVEPNAAMRRAAEEFLRDFPRFKSIDGTAEKTNLPAEEVDFVVAAQAFHWFDPEKTPAEFRRILRAGGAVALIWNERQLDSNDFLREYEDFLKKHGTDYAQVRHDNLNKNIFEKAFQTEFELKTFPNVQTLDFEGLKGRVLSSSYMPAESDARFAPMIAELERLFAKYAENGKIQILYNTNVFFTPEFKTRRFMEVKPELKREIRTITVAHSPDSDDAFMFYGLATNKLETEGLKFEHTLKDIQSLNEDAKNGVYDVTAISFHAYAYVADKYALLPHGASIGDKYGPIVVAKERYNQDDIPNLKIAVPGELTSAFLALKIFNQDFQYVVVPFDEIIEYVQKGKADAGLLIHEGQLFYKQMGLNKVLDLGEWWHERTGLPLPMGGNAIKRELGDELMRQVSKHLHRSIVYSMENREDALAYAMQFARDMPTELADRFVAMWVNDLTLDYGERGRQGVRRLLEEGHEKGIIPHLPQIDFVE